MLQDLDELPWVERIAEWSGRTRSGYFAPLVDAGETVLVGQTIAALTRSPGDPIDPPKAHTLETESKGDARRWTKKAEILARKHGLDTIFLLAPTSTPDRLSSTSSCG